MKHIKKLLVFTLIIGFMASLVSCSSNRGYYKKGKKKRKKGCNCPSFSADAMHQTISWEKSISIEHT